MPIYLIYILIFGQKYMAYIYFPYPHWLMLPGTTLFFLAIWMCMRYFISCDILLFVNYIYIVYIDA